MKQLLMVAALLLSLGNGASAQDSLGEVARQNREKKPSQPRAKTVLDDDSEWRRNSTRFAVLAEHGLDNTDEVIRTMEQFRQSHTPEETEAAIREWFESYDEAMSTAIDEAKELKERHMKRISGRPLNVTDRVSDYQQYQRQRESELRADDDDWKKFEADGLLTARIQQAFTKVRNYLSSKNLRYEWFKIRFGNGNGSW